MNATYIPGYGYTVRDSRGIILGRNLGPAAKDRLMSCAHISVLSATLLASILAAGG